MDRDILDRLFDMRDYLNSIELLADDNHRNIALIDTAIDDLHFIKRLLGGNKLWL